MTSSRIPGFYRLSVAERIDELLRLGWLDAPDAAALHAGSHVLKPHAADRIIENVIGSFGLPFAIAPNFLVNGREYIVPLVVEEPSIVAALSGAAQLARSTGGFTAECDESLLIGQVHLCDLEDTASASAGILAAKETLLALANEVHPRLSQRGGGVRDIEVRELLLADDASSLAIHVLVDTCDAMGANLVNQICESLAPALVEICGGSAAMSILSNLADRSIVTARVEYGLGELAPSEAEATVIRDAIVRADRIAHADPYRAATHNKGIMNGIDALAIATGNDWRAIEAGAHAFAAKHGQYRPLSQWSVGAAGELLGEIRLPLKPGVVGGTLEANAAAAIGLKLCNVESARELAMLMASVGLAQNFAAIRALATSGIQKGHMRLHARSVAAAAGVPDTLFDEVVTELVATGEIKDWKARELLAAKTASSAIDGSAGAAGKVILLGEHAVVYGKHAVALPIPDAVAAHVTGHPVAGPWSEHVGRATAVIGKELGVDVAGLGIELHSRLPAAMGLGSSAAIAVAMVRALATHFNQELDATRVNAIAFECEKLAHGTPSGLDNSVATFATPMLFRNGESPEVSPIELAELPPVVIACSGTRGMTADQVAGVRQRRERSPERYDAIFGEIDALSLQGASYLEAADYARLGALMNICHGLLNAIEVSTPELESMVAIARAAGACGAKLTGAGGGGSIVALCPGAEDSVESALQSMGYFTVRLNGEDAAGSG